MDREHNSCEPYFLPQDVDKLHDELFISMESMGYILSYFKEYDTPQMRESWEALAKLSKNFYDGYMQITQESSQEAQN